MSFENSLKNNNFELIASESQMVTVSGKAERACEELLSNMRNIKKIVEDSSLYWTTESAKSEREKFQLEVSQLETLEKLLDEYKNKLQAIESKFSGESMPEEFILPEDILS